jgi:hypothetical protein
LVDEFTNPRKQKVAGLGQGSADDNQTGTENAHHVGVLRLTSATPQKGLLRQAPHSCLSGLVDKFDADISYFSPANDALFPSPIFEEKLETVWDTCSARHNQFGPDCRKVSHGTVSRQRAIAIDNPCPFESPRSDGVSVFTHRFPIGAKWFQCNSINQYYAWLHLFQVAR